MQQWDIAVIGGGPAGLAFAHTASQSTSRPRILVIEKEANLGGCHRVSRVPVRGEMLFTEHSPRVYTSRYVTFARLIQDFGLTFDDLFVPYSFRLTEIGQKNVVEYLSWRERFLLALAFLRLFWDTDYGRDISVAEFMHHAEFSPEAWDAIDRVCRLTDGAGSERYSLNKLLQGINQFATLYQPRLPTDRGLFAIWRDFLQSSGGVSFRLGETLQRIERTGPRSFALIVSNETGRETVIQANRVVLSMPPQHMVPVLGRSNMMDAFGSGLPAFAERTKYDHQIAMVFHYDRVLDLPKIQGFPGSEWGIAFVVLTDYMTFSEKQSRTVLSFVITYTHRPSRRTGKTALQCSDQELEDEIWEYANTSVFPGIPRPTVAIRTRVQDEAYIEAPGTRPLPFGSASIPGLFNAGTHNGYSPFKFTSMETAVDNGVKLATLMFPDTANRYLTVPDRDIVAWVRVLVFFVLGMIVVIYRRRSGS